MSAAPESSKPALDDASPVAGVMGWPIAHSKSPQIHGHWLQTLGLRGDYVPLAVEPDALERAVSGAWALGLAGFNVTLPHKEAMVGLCAEVSETARAMGAVNTVWRAEGGWYGTNTDGFGFIENLRSAGGLRPTGPALVLGAGGSARAVVWSLRAEGYPEIRLANRTLARAEALADDLGRERLRPIRWSEAEAMSAGCALVVNTTSLGMTGQPALDISLDTLSAEAVVTDLVYSPLETDLLARARARGLTAVDGLGMLLHQARPGFEAWFGAKPTVSPALREAVLRERPIQGAPPP
ncbi:MAG: shikimate dehydrogenase [Pseudomonadota bacterium]